MSRESIVFIGAHPDDTEGFGATAFLLRDAFDIHVVDLTHGELGLGRAGLVDGSTAATRTQEERDACALLGATPHFLAEIDGDAHAGGSSVSLLAAILKDLRPRAVFTHWPVDNHQDHVQAAAVTAHALWRLDYKPEVYFFEVMFAQTANFVPLYYVDVSSVMERKAALLRAYPCQNRDDCILNDNLKRARIRGAEAMPPVAAAEAFTTHDGAPIPGGVLEPFARRGLPLLRRAVDGPVELPDFDKKAWAFHKGYRPLGVRADECTAKGALIDDLTTVTTVRGRRLAPGRDFRADPEWGTVGLLPGAPREAVRLSYAYVEQRIDAIVEKDGVQTRRSGEPHVCRPLPPPLREGERRVENILVSADGEEHFPILAAADDAPRTAPGAETATPQTLAKLRAGEPVTILAWGDSVTEAAYLPEHERWQGQFVRRLRRAFPTSAITLVTNGWGGRCLRNFLDEPAGSQHNFEEKVAGLKPDLVVSELCNDAGRPADEISSGYEFVLAAFRARGIEWVALTPHYFRRDWMGLAAQRDCDDDPRPYTDFLRRFAREKGIGLADAALRWGHLWREGIPYETLLRNNINHPDASAMAFFADALMDFFGVAEPPSPPGARAP